MNVAVIGTGVIGAGWVARFLLHGHNVRVFDPQLVPERLNATIGRARNHLTALYDIALPAEGELTLCESLVDAVQDVQWVQESTPEVLERKRAVLAHIMAASPTDAVVGSSTSGFKPSDLQQGLDDCSRVMVCHPFNPVYLLPLVEVVASEQTDPALVQHACEVLTSVGMKPLVVSKEIDAHIADRLLEAVWREALWLVRDGVATTEQVDDAIRYGFGLRWAQMGLFETYRIGGGDAGMRHFLQQFGPALAWPWSRLTDVPELDETLVETIARQSDDQAAGRSVTALEQERDTNLVAILKALKSVDAAAGADLNAWERATRNLQ